MRSDIATLDDAVQRALKHYGLLAPDVEILVFETPTLLAYHTWREMPVRYAHWSWGKRLEMLDAARSNSSVYIDVRGIPGRMLWLCETDHAARQLFSIVRARLHHDFSLRNKACMRATQMFPPEHAREHARCVRTLIQEHGKMNVEQTLTAAHTVRRQWGNVSAPSGGILQFLRTKKHNPRMAVWQRDLLKIIEAEWPLYAAESYTALLRESWVSGWQDKILHAVSPDAPVAVDLAKISAFFKLMPPEPRIGFLAHLVGRAMFDELEASNGLAACFRAAEAISDDAQFVRKYLSAASMQRAGIAAARGVSYPPKKFEISEIPENENEAKVIRNALALQVGRNAYPIVRLAHIDDDGVPVFEHVFEGRFIDRKSAIEEVLPKMVYLWGAPVRFRFREARRGPQTSQSSPEWGTILVEETCFSSDGSIPFARRELEPFTPINPPELPMNFNPM